MPKVPVATLTITQQEGKSDGEEVTAKRDSSFNQVEFKYPLQFFLKTRLHEHRARAPLHIGRSSKKLGALKLKLHELCGKSTFAPELSVYSYCPSMAPVDTMTEGEGVGGQ